jgi:hypothetical protein
MKKKIHVGPRKTEGRRWLIKEIIIINGLKIMARNGLRLPMLQERMLNDKKKKPGSDLLQTINHF